MAGKRRAKSKAKGKRTGKSAEPTRARTRARDPKIAPDVKAFLNKWKGEKREDRERAKRPPKAAPAPPSPPPKPPREPSSAAVTDSGRNVAALTKIWKNLELAEELVILGGVGVSVTRRLMEECGFTRRTARQHQAAAYLRLAEEGERETRELRLVRYRRMLERQHERADLIGDHKAAVAAAVGLIKMEGGFERHGMGLPGGRVPNGSGAVRRLQATIDAPVDEQDTPVRVSVAELTAELIAARDAGEDV
jgi:hypothetical protein